MSVWRFIEQAFPADEICPYWLWEQLIAAPRERVEQWSVFRGHFLSHLEPYLGRPLATFTMLREPVVRTISHFHPVRRAREHPFHTKALEMSLREFCLDPATRHMVENYQCCYLAKVPMDPAEIARGMSDEQMARFELQEILQSPDPNVGLEALYRRAAQRLSSFAAIGFAEDFDDSIARFTRVFGCPEPKPFEPDNVNPERTPISEVDPATLDVIRRLTACDRARYEFGRTLV